MIQFTKENLQEMLKTGIYKITFTKVDGTTRVLRGTLMPEYLPVGDNTYLVEGEMKEVHHRPENPNTVSVWDLDKNGWRSFRIDSLQGPMWEEIS